LSKFFPEVPGYPPKPADEDIQEAMLYWASEKKLTLQKFNDPLKTIWGIIDSKDLLNEIKLIKSPTNPCINSVKHKMFDVVTKEK
jgi:hypothetical protein